MNRDKKSKGPLDEVEKAKSNSRHRPATTLNTIEEDLHET